ncbi:MAG: MBOAT family O-acyltransferase [Crocinitomicaceae bacterium]
MQLHQTLPFTDNAFFLFLGIVVISIWIVKRLLKQYIPYKWLLATTSLIYIVLLFNKPINILVLILALYCVVLLLRKYYKKENIIFPMLVLALPIFAVKMLGIIAVEGQSITIRDFRSFIQIAGLSYMIFKVISLYIDERHHNHKIEFIDFFNFTAFTPTLLIGPLDRFNRFKTDTENGYQNMTSELAYKGWENFILGLLFKFIIAEAIRRLVLQYIVVEESIWQHVAYMYSYLLYLFFDFAGYSLLAISAGNFIGIHVPINFNKPFSAVNPKEFWKRWHKSLGDWLNDYFFKPLFKDFTSRKVWNSIQRQNVALLLTFTLMGFWNGFELHYIASGILFGLYSVIHNYYVYRCKKTKKDVFFGKLPPPIVKVLSILIMFNAVAFAIYIFSGKLI